MEPRAISHFDILGRLAAGGMGVVYRARDRVLERDVALKLVRPDRSGDRNARRRFLREARAAAVLSHPGIAAIYEAGEAVVEGLGEDPQLYIAEELVEGETLAAYARRGPLPIDTVVRLGIELGEALGAAHDRGIVHRDVKPSNLMVTPAGALKVLDFGIAKRGLWAGDSAGGEITEQTVSRTAPGLLVGTPAYMAPEQIAGGSLGPPVDIYAAGCVLYELLIGQPPFAGGNLLTAIRQRLTEGPRPVARLRPDVPATVSSVISRTLERDPGKRYANGQDLALALRESATGRVEAGPPLQRGRTARVARAAAGALLGVAIAAAMWLGLVRLLRM